MCASSCVGFEQLCMLIITLGQRGYGTSNTVAKSMSLGHGTVSSSVKCFNGRTHPLSGEEDEERLPRTALGTRQVCSKW